MIYLDDSRGSGELYRYFSPYGLRVVMSDLVPMGGDAWFMGIGDVSVVIERKRITDLIDSMKSKRLKGYQIPLMHDNYDLVYIIVEGMWRPGQGGMLEEYRRVDGVWQWVGLGVQYRAVDNFMTSLGPYCEQVKRSATPDETVVQIVNLYRYYQEKREDILHIYSPDPTFNVKGRKVRTRARKATWAEKFAYIFPGIDGKTESVAAHFKTHRAAVNASVEEWRKIPGIGKVTAANIQRALDAEGADL